MSQQPGAAPESPTVFFSYARVDAPIVRDFAEQLQVAGIQVFLDVEFLRPGERFETAIFDKLRSADALVSFVSPSSLQSEWAEAEVLAFSAAGNKPIFPVLINGASPHDLPRSLVEYQAVRVDNDSAIPVAARRLADVLKSSVSESREFSPEAEGRAAELAAGIAAGIRTPAIDPVKAANSVFLVHGHDRDFRDEVEMHLKGLGIQPVVLSKVGGEPRSLFDKFETLASQAAFAVVLISPDDLGASRDQYEDSERGGERTLKYRARENVILELGYFYGHLGWDHVFVVQKSAEHPWPDFERPSDLAGVVFVETSADVDWREELTGKLREAELLPSNLDGEKFVLITHTFPVPSRPPALSYRCSCQRDPIA